MEVRLKNKFKNFSFMNNLNWIIKDLKKPMNI